MATRHCPKCGREAGEGKRFCGGCGAALAATSAPPDSEQVPTSESAALKCDACGAALAPGKRFCKQCGRAVGEASPKPEATTTVPAAVAESAEAVCVQCGAPLTPGKHFCKLCGHSVEPKVDATTTAVAKQDVLLELETAPAPVSEAVPVPESVTASKLEPGKPTRRSIPYLGLAIGVGCALLVAGAGWIWYAHAHRAAAVTQLSAASQQVPAQATANTNPVSAPAQGPSAKPFPGSSTASPSTVQQTAQPRPVAPLQVSPPTPKPNEPVRQPPTHVVVPPPVVTNSPRSGVQHYQGPPVPYNGQVVYDHLPKDRLRFTYDHQAWSLTIKMNADGTKRVTLTSQKPGYQTSCDLEWEVVG